MRRLTVAFLMPVLFVSCGGYTTGVLQKSEKAFLKFSGSTQSVSISVDDGDAFLVDPKIDQYQVKPGKHTVKAFRNNQLILNRSVIVDNEVTLEIEIP